MCRLRTRGLRNVLSHVLLCLIAMLMTALSLIKNGFADKMRSPTLARALTKEAMCPSLWAFFSCRLQPAVRCKNGAAELWGGMGHRAGRPAHLTNQICRLNAITIHTARAFRSSNSAGRTIDSTTTITDLTVQFTTAAPRYTHTQKRLANMTEAGHE